MGFCQDFEGTWQDFCILSDSSPCISWRTFRPGTTSAWRAGRATITVSSFGMFGDTKDWSLPTYLLGALKKSDNFLS